MVSETKTIVPEVARNFEVLILVLVEDGLRVGIEAILEDRVFYVLILVLVEDGLREHQHLKNKDYGKQS